MCVCLVAHFVLLRAFFLFLLLCDNSVSKKNGGRWGEKLPRVVMMCNKMG